MTTSQLPTAIGGPTTEPPGSPSLGERIARAARLDRYSGLYTIAVLVAMFAATVPQLFLTEATFRTLLSENSITAILALGLLVPLACGVFDLSIAGVLGLSVILVAWLQARVGLDPLTASLITVACGALIGVVNAVVVVRLEVNSFIATLGMSSILAAGTVAVSGNKDITSGVSSAFQKFGSAVLAGIPVTAIYMVLFAAVLWWALERTQPGRFLYAVGGNPVASRLAGIRTGRYVAGSLVVSSTVAAVAGIIFTAKIGSASLTAGPPYLLPAFAAVFLGATQIRPGRVNVLGTLVAVFLLAIGVKGLQLWGVPSWVNTLFNGVALITAVALSNVRRGGRQVAVNA